MQSTRNSTSPRSARGARTLAGLLLASTLLAGGTACTSGATPEELLARGDYRAARLLLEQRAGGGDAAAQNRLGVLYYLGLGAPVDYARAADLFKRAALAGDADAQRNLGSMFRQGLGVPRDELRAFGWYDAARKTGNPRAHDYMQWMTQHVGWNQQAFARRIVAEDLRKGTVSECGEGLLMSACPPAPRGAAAEERPNDNP